MIKGLADRWGHVGCTIVINCFPAMPRRQKWCTYGILAYCHSCIFNVVEI